MKLTGLRPMGVALAAVLAATAAHAEPLRGVAYAGGTVSESVSGYAGAVVSLPGAELGDGGLIKAGVASGRYEYDASGMNITGKYASVEAALGYQLSGPWGWANASAGPNYSHTTLTPGDPANKLSGSRWDLNLQSDGAFDGATWRLGWYGSYGAFNNAYQARLQLGNRIAGSNLRVGVEAGVQGDASYTRGFGGAFASKPVGKNLDLLIAAGASEQAGRSARAYGTIGISRLF